jgi:hypothetical protein
MAKTPTETIDLTAEMLASVAGGTRAPRADRLSHSTSGKLSTKLPKLHKKPKLGSGVGRSSPGGIGGGSP